MKKFEYKCIKIDVNEHRKDIVKSTDDDFDDNYITEVVLNDYGEEGWELITILNRDNFFNITTVILKKELI